MAREFYRIVRSERPTVDDFRSARELGKPPVAKYLREWAESISVHDDLDHSMTHALNNRLKLGRHIVRLLVPDDGRIEVVQSDLMETFFQLVELTSGNVADDFESLDEAAEAINAAVRQYGADAMRTYSLLEFANGSSTLVAMEDELLDLVARHPVGTLAST